MKTPRKILLLPICGLGDAVAYIPYLQAKRAKFPQSENMVGVATAAAATVLKDNVPGVDVTVFNRSHEKHRWASLIGLVRSVRRRKFDLVLSGAHPNSLRVPLFAFVSGARLKVGAKSERMSFLYNRRVDVPLEGHYTDRYTALLKSIDVPVTVENSEPRLHPPQRALTSARKLWNDAGLADADMVIGLVSGADTNARGIWQPHLKRWTNEGYAEVAKWAVSEYGARIIMIGSAAEAEFAGKIASLSGVPIVNFCGKTDLRELQWIISKCTAIVSNDTGTMHLAGALGTQVLALFGPTSAESFRPPGSANRIIQGTAPCSPCYPHPTCGLKTCQAMESISAAQVVDGLSLLLFSSKQTVVPQK